MPLFDQMSGGMKVGLLGGGVAILVALGVWGSGIGARPEKVEVEPVGQPVERDRPRELVEIVVSIQGEVKRPGLVTLRQGARVAEAIEYCGGATGDADLTQVNLAQRLSDGMQIVVPRMGGIVGGNGGDGGGDLGDIGLVSINSATVQELERLPGIGPVLAGEIVGYRLNNGPFYQLEDLMNVPGIGEKTFEEIRGNLTL